MPPPRLSLSKILWGTFAFPALYRDAYLKAVGVPMLAVMAATSLWLVCQTTITGFVLWLCFLPCFIAICWLAVRTHRLVLSGGPAGPPTFAQVRSSTSTYLATVFLGSVAYVLAWLALVSLVVAVTFTRYVPAGAPAPGPDADTQHSYDFIALGVSIPLLYCVARFILVLPAVALGQRLDLRAAWEHSRGNGWRLVVATVLLPRLFRHALDLLGGFGTHIAVIGVVVVLAAVVTSLEVIALSLSYRELVGPPA